ncbi:MULTISPECIES: ABC transporter permease [Bacillaceae]|uniref:ABC transporter n=1 Tax=Domibacillus aminovorans TaxID=29332 RepID=A0A177KM87_9BACI|nr:MULTISPECIES: ABC transporter permease [Bacillaceae]OAH54548.1 ABC transporter [Domibacillus aminovorans]
MNVSMKRVGAIFVKDWKDLMRNSYVLFTVFMPVVFAAILGRMGMENPGMFMLPINMALVMCAAFVQASMIAEEKEKNTLRGLMLSPASTLDIFIGKSVLTGAVTIVVIILSIWLSEVQLTGIAPLSIAILFSLIAYISIGTIIGLLSRNVMETGIVGMPVLVVFLGSSFIMQIVENEFIKKMLSYLPNEQLSSMAVQLHGGAAFGEVTSQLAVIAVWAVVSIALTVVMYKKSAADK